MGTIRVNKASRWLLSQAKYVKAFGHRDGSGEFGVEVWAFDSYHVMVGGGDVPLRFADRRAIYRWLRRNRPALAVEFAEQCMESGEYVR